MSLGTYSSEEAELRRLDAHFDRVLGALHRKSVAGLSRAQRRARRGHLEHLAAYRRGGVFPKNTRHFGQVLPLFIDDAGTRCAMGALVEASGARDLVQYIARERNTERIATLRDIPELLSWLERNGLSAEEAAAIQPSYCAVPALACVCGHAFSYYSEGVIAGTATNGGASLTVISVYGNASDVQVGDVVPVTDPHGVIPSSELVFASMLSDGSAVAQYSAVSAGGGGNSTITIKPATCTAELLMDPIKVPGALPMPVVDQALSASNGDECVQVLGQHDALWSQMQCDGEGYGGYGGSVGLGGNAGSAGSHAAGAGGTAGGTAIRPSSDSGGCNVALSPGFGAEALVALATALAVHGMRRASRRS